jgi:hypothetical protein
MSQLPTWVWCLIALLAFFLGAVLGSLTRPQRRLRVWAAKGNEVTQQVQDVSSVDVELTTPEGVVIVIDDAPTAVSEN